MGELFRSFDEAWMRFLAREEPLEPFWDELPDDEEATVDVWLLLPDDAVRDAAAEVQRSFARIDWAVPLPRHFLHVTLASSDERADGAVWHGAGRFALELGPVTCFHDAVVAEAHGDGTHRLRALAGLPLERHLPHLSLGYLRGRGDPAALRDVLVPLRGLRLGRLTAVEAVLCRVAVGRTKLFTPWQVLETVALGAPR